MKQIIIFIAGIFILSTINYAQTPEIEWIRTFGGTDGDWTECAQQTIDGGYILTGITYSFGAGDYDAWLIKTDENGNEEWSKTYGDSLSEMGRWVEQTFDGGYIIAGQKAIGPGQIDALLIKTDSNGIVQWEKTYGGSMTDRAYSGQQTSDGGYIICGDTYSSEPNGDILLIKTDSNGNMQWEKVLGGSSSDRGHFARQTTDGGYIIVGNSRSFGLVDHDVWLIKVDINGNIEWDNFFGGAGDQVGYSVEQTDDGGFIVAGYTPVSTSNWDCYLIKTNSSGVLEWEKTFGGAGQEIAHSVAQTSDGGYILGGYTTFPSNQDIWILKTNGSGNLEWDKTIGVAFQGEGYSVRQTDDNGYIIAGVTLDSGFVQDAILVKIEGESNSVAWSNANGGAFSEGSNWVGGSSPAVTQVALFDSSYYSTSQINSIQPITVTFNDITTTSGLTIAESQILFDLQQHSYEVSELKIGGLGFPDESQLEIINGVLGTTNNLDIGVGNRPGQLIVNSGGILEVASSTSQPLLQVGSGDCGGGDCARLIIQNGGVVFSNGTEVGKNGAQAGIFLSGSGSEWNDSLFTVIADSGVASFNIINGGFFSGKRLFVSQSNNSEGVISVQGEDSKIFIDEFLDLGFYGNGTLNISNSADVEIFDQTVLGVESGSSGELFVEGSGSKFTTNKLFVGDFGSGGFTVSDSGTATINQKVMVPNGGNGIGSILIDGVGSNLEISGDIKIGFLGVGFVRLTNQGVLTANSIRLGPLGSIDISGGIVYVGGNSPSASGNFLMNENSFAGEAIFVDTLLLSENSELLTSAVEFGEGGYLGGEGNISFDIINSGGLNPGDSINTPGLLVLDANYTQQINGTLFIELEGNTPGSGFDKLIVNGTAQIAGTLDVSALNLFEPFVSQTFEVVSATNISGTFDNIITHRGLGVDVSYSSTSITLTVTSPVSVDENNNSAIPKKYSLEQNYPNPFNPTTIIQYSIPKESNVTLKVYDVLGKEVATLVNEKKSAGNYQLNFDASPLPSGIYFYQIVAGSFVQTKKMTLIK